MEPYGSPPWVVPQWEDIEVTVIEARDKKVGMVYQ
jgi:hypothetical protein